MLHKPTEFSLDRMRSRLANLEKDVLEAKQRLECYLQMLSSLPEFKELAKTPKELKKERQKRAILNFFSL